MSEQNTEKWVKAYGDTMNDGRVQLSFTLPVPLDENAKYVFSTMRDLHSEIEFKAGGKIESRAQQVLAEAETVLAEIEKIGLPAAIGQGTFAEISRTPTGGKGLDGVITKAADYFNPFPQLMMQGA